MTHGARHYFTTNYFQSLAVRRAVCRTSALTATAFIGASFLTALFAPPPLERSGVVQAPLASNSETYSALLDIRFESYFSPTTFSQSISLRSDDHPAPPAWSQLASLEEPNIATTPAESSRAPQRPASGQHPLLRMPKHAAPSVNPKSNENSPDDATTPFKSFFTKLLTKTSAALRLAYADPDQGPLSDGGKIVDRHDQWTAVYDISAHTVYMPDGTKLEAHSGFGTSLDDPRHVDEKDQGPTPPNVYNLELREQPFHGVPALRLVPVDEKKALGRTGLLAHSFLLGPNGQSNGCVSFRDYDAFLHAYVNHQVKRLVVVASLD
jgi:Protein of unknown function (DUF2778)